MRLSSSRPREEPEVTLTPLIDVVFLLLLFFMLSTTFNRQAQLKVDLPQASNTPTEAPKDILQVTIKQNGNIYINDQQVVNNKAATIKRALQQVMHGKTDIPLIIRADSDSALQYVVTVMDVARQLNIEQLSLATVQPQPAE